MPATVHLSRLTPLSFLERSATAFPDRLAVVDGDRRLTWSELRERARRLAVALQASGIERGDRVAFLAPNTVELLEAHYGVPGAGAVLVAINTRLTRDEIAYILGHCGARMLVVDHTLAHLADGAALERVIVCGDGGEYEEFLAAAGEGEPEDRIESEDDTISINYTSGTTGRPKGVMYTYRGAYLNALSEAAHSRLDSRSVYLWTLPMFHCHGWAFTWAVTAMGGQHRCLARFDAGKVWGMLAAGDVSHLCGAPTVLTMLAADPAATRLPHPVRVFVGGAPPSPALLHVVEELGMQVTHLYGLTETYGPIAVCAWQPAWDALDAPQRMVMRSRQGVATVVSETLRVVDQDLTDVPADGETMGEIVMRGNNVALGYYRDEAATAAAFAGGWFRSGDLGVMHPDGYVEIRDRAKDMIISGGENISSIEVEHGLAAHPDVVEVAVVAVPDDVWGEVPKAYVVVSNGAHLTEEDIREYGRTRLARHKVPKMVEFVDALPKTATGKVQKHVLRERCAR